MYASHCEVAVVKLRISLAKIMAQCGVGIRYVTFIYLVYQVWHSPLAVGAALGVPSLAQWILGPLAGLLADKFHRPRIIALMYALQCTALLGLMALTYFGHASTLVVTLLTYFLFFVINGADILMNPSFNTLMTELVESNELVRWQAGLNSWGQGVWLGGLILTGFFIERVGATFALTIILLITVAAFLCSASLPETERRLAIGNTSVQDGKKLSLFTGFRQAWSAIKNDKFLWTFMWVVAITNIPHNVLLSLPFFLSTDVHAGYTGFSVIEAALAVGTMLASLWFTRRNQTYRINHLLSAAFFIQCLATVCLFFAAIQHSIALVTVLMAVYGATDSLFGPAYSLMSVTSPVEVRGQVFGLFNVVAVILNPLMSIFTGWLVSLTTIPVILVLLVAMFGVTAATLLKLPSLARQI